METVLLQLMDWQEEAANKLLIMNSFLLCSPGPLELFKTSCSEHKGIDAAAILLQQSDRCKEGINDNVAIYYPSNCMSEICVQVRNFSYAFFISTATSGLLEPAAANSWQASTAAAEIQWINVPSENILLLLLLID